MTSPPSRPPPPPPGILNSRGHSLFALQVQRNAKELSGSVNLDAPPLSPQLKPAASIRPSPSLIQRRLPLGSSESYPHSDNTNVQLISVQQRPEANYIKELPPSSTPGKRPEKLQETDFPLVETPVMEEIETTTHEDAVENYTTCEAFLEKAFDYLNSHDDDDDVVHQLNEQEQQYHSDSFDDDEGSVDTMDLPASLVTADLHNESKCRAVELHHPEKRIDLIRLSDSSLASRTQFNQSARCDVFVAHPLSRESTRWL